MAAPAHAYGCEVCGRPLRAARVRQGVRVHKECRQGREGRAIRHGEAPRPASGDAAATLERMRSALASLPAGARDPELRELFALAAAQARELAADLERLRALAAGGQR